MPMTSSGTDLPGLVKLVVRVTGPRNVSFEDGFRVTPYGEIGNRWVAGIRQELGTNPGCPRPGGRAVRLHRPRPLRRGPADRHLGAAAGPGKLSLPTRGVAAGSSSTGATIW
jgi:hypothetical protein